MNDYDGYPLVAMGDVVRERGMNPRDAWAILDVVGPLIRAEALREAAALADVGHGAGCEANPDGDCLGCFRDDLLRLASSGQIKEERTGNNSERPSTDDLFAADLEWTGGMSVDEYMNRARRRQAEEER